MFEDLFIDRGTIAKYHAAPLLEERLSYLRHCAQDGARTPTLRKIAVHQTSLIHFLDLHEGDRVNVAQVEAAAGQWSLPGGRRCSRPALPQACQRFFGHAVRWLRFVSLLEEPCKAQHAHAGAVAVFAAWMREERGWSEDTIRGCRSTVDRFFDRPDERGVALAAVRIADIDQAVARWHARDCSRITIHDYAQRLRTFFRFAERQGWCTLGLADGIMPSRFHPGETVPKGLNRDEVLRLLATTEGDRPVDLRDRAILMVLIAYGLRSGEVAGLRLDDLDWEEETLRVRCPKPGRTLGPWLRRFLAEHIVTERNLARNTQKSYRDTFALLLPFVGTRTRKPVDRLAVQDLTARRVLQFLAHLEDDRGCSVQTRNQRLTAICAFARFVASRDLGHLEWSTNIRAIALKKATPQPIGWLSKTEMKSLLEVPDRRTPRGRVEHALIGWTPQLREKNLPLVVDNPRFLILPWIEIPNLGSHILP